MNLPPCPPVEIYPGVVLRGLAALFVKSVVVDEPNALFTRITVLCRGPNVDDPMGGWGEIGSSETVNMNVHRESVRAVIVRVLRRMWEHEWDEALVVDGEVVGRPH